MKLRLYNDSVRLRLGRGEVSAVAAGETVSQTTIFLSANLTCSLTPTAADRPAADLVDGQICVILPLDAARQWADTDQVGIEFRVPTRHGRSLQILIEKDFQCLDNPADGPADAYENPHHACAPADA